MTGGVRVLNMMGAPARGAIEAAVPGIHVIDVAADRQPHPAVAGEVLFAAWVDSPVYAHLDDLGVRWMHLPGTGIDGWPRELLEGRTVTCSRGVSAVPIAEFVMAAILAFEKRLPGVWLRRAPRGWHEPKAGALGELAGRTVGLIGLGGIGVAVAQRANAFEMRVLALRRTRTPSPVPGVDLAFGLTDLLAAADHLVIAAPATHRTHRLLDAQALQWIKPGAHVVNVSRGSLVDQTALRAALDDGRIALATLDTVEPEPLPEGHWLYSHPKVRLSAHVSWSSPRALDRVVGSFVTNLRRYIAGEPLLGVVDLDEGY